MIDKRPDTIYKPDGDNHYSNGIHKQNKSCSTVSPLMGKLLGIKEEDDKIELFPSANDQHKKLFNFSNFWKSICNSYIYIR